MNSVMQRDKTIDMLRGLAIVLVVVGHAVQSLHVNFDSNIAFRFIYASHMPLFMFVSGYAAGFSAETKRKIDIYKKFLTLIIPFLSWYILAYFVNHSWEVISIKDYVVRVIVSPDWGLWFLPILFFCYLLLVLGKVLEPRFGLVVYPGIWLGLQLVPTGFFGMGLLKWHFLFFMIGYLANYKYKVVRVKLPLIVTVGIGCIYLGGVLLWYRTMTTIDVTVLKFLPIPNNDLTHPIIITIFKYLVALLGIVFWWLTVSAFSNKSKLKTHLSHLGLFTLDIYVCHLYFFRFSFGMSLVKLATSIVFGLVMPLALSYILLRRFNLLNKLLLGTRPLSDFSKFVRWFSAS